MYRFEVAGVRLLFLTQNWFDSSRWIDGSTVTGDGSDAVTVKMAQRGNELIQVEINLRQIWELYSSLRILSWIDTIFY